MCLPWETELRRRYPTPSTDGIDAYYFSLDGGGRRLVIDAIRQRDARVMIEIGSFLGGSTIQWLEASENLAVIGVDPWEADFASFLDRYSTNPAFDNCFAKIEDRSAFIASVRRHGPYLSALANVRAYADRFVPVRAHSPKVLHELASLGVEPDIVYFDSNKLLDDLQVARQLFPSARLCGDDWTWGADQGFPVRATVTTFCEQHGLTIRAERATWISDPAR